MTDILTDEELELIQECAVCYVLFGEWYGLSAVSDINSDIEYITILDIFSATMKILRTHGIDSDRYLYMA